MKKILFVTVALSLVGLFACKSENKQIIEETNTEQKDSLQTETNLRETTEETTIVVPDFANQEAATFAKKYNDYVIELKAAAGENQEKLTELTSKAVSLEKEFQQINGTLSPEDSKKLTKFIDDLKASVQ